MVLKINKVKDVKSFFMIKGLVSILIPEIKKDQL